VRTIRLVAAVALAFVATAGAAPDAPGGPAVPATAAGHYRGFDDAAGFLSILAPGEAGDATSAHLADQRGMYDALLFARSPTDDELTRYYHDASFGVRADDIARVYHPHADVTVIRDRSTGVPHIFGTTRYATLFAEGYTTAEDRLLTMDVLRRVGRGTLAELVGSAGVAMDQDTTRDSPYTEADLARQVRRLERSSPQGNAVVDDLGAYVDGVNRFVDEVRHDDSLLPGEYRLLGRAPTPWTVTDAVATASDIGEIFGRGGGRELENWCGLRGLAQQLGSAGARTVFDDLKFADDPAAPTTSSRPAPYMTGADGLGSPDAAAVPDVDCATLQAAGGARTPSGLGNGTFGVGTPDFLAPLLDAIGQALDASAAPAASNAVLVAGKATASGRPIAVFGPQIGYSVPSLLEEKDVHGPGIDARGVGFAGIDAYVLIGRGRDYAWSATSSGADDTDTFVLKLCDPAGGTATTSSTGYVHDGRCRSIERFTHTEQVAQLGGGTAGTATWTVERAPDYGPITARGTTTDGSPIAIATERSTYGDELRSALGFRKLNDPDQMRPGFSAFRDATGAGIDFTFNWLYVDGAHIGYQHSCKCPLRAKGVDPALPTWGTGRWDWHGDLAPDAEPYQLDPARGLLVSWNNREAPGFRASDAQFSFGPVNRVQLLESRVQTAVGRGGLHPSDVVALAEDAATVDLRGEEVLPTLLDALGAQAPVGADPRVADLRARLAAWVDTGAHRRATTPGGPYDDAVAPAVMDAWWSVLPSTIFGPAAGSPFQTLGLTVDDSPRQHRGSAWDDGAYSAVEQDLLQVLGRRVAGAWPHAFCGGGDLAACRQQLWSSLGTAAGLLQQEFGSPDVATWQRRPADDEIRFRATVTGLPPIDWQNRPTYQQVVQLRTRGTAGISTTGGGGGILTIVISAIVGVLVAGGALLIARRQMQTQPAGPRGAARRQPAPRIGPSPPAGPRRNGNGSEG